MKFSTAFIALLSVGLSSASSLRLVRRDDHDIPGESPLRLCDGDHGDDLLQITKVDLNPNPPKAGQTLVIEANGALSTTIEEGAYVNLSVKYGLIRLINTKADLCEQIKNVNLECPIEKGILSIAKSVDLPNEIPPVSFCINYNSAIAALALILDEFLRHTLTTTRTLLGNLHCFRRRLHQRRQEDHLPDSHGQILKGEHRYSLGRFVKAVLYR
ncbi:hypothetical protein RB601_003457 [Gaeumannomyces tritici]